MGKTCFYKHMYVVMALIVANPLKIHKIHQKVTPLKYIKSAPPTQEIALFFHGSTWTSMVCQKEKKKILNQRCNMLGFYSLGCQLCFLK